METTTETDDPFLKFAESLDAAEALTPKPTTAPTRKLDTWEVAVDEAARIYDELETRKAGIRAYGGALRDLLMNHPAVLALSPDTGESSEVILKGEHSLIKAVKTRTPKFDQKELRRLDVDGQPPDPLTVRYSVADISRLADPEAVIDGYRDTVRFKAVDPTSF